MICVCVAWMIHASDHNLSDRYGQFILLSFSYSLHYKVYINLEEIIISQIACEPIYLHSIVTYFV